MTVTTHYLPKTDDPARRIHDIARVVAFLEGLPLEKSWRNDNKPAKSERSIGVNAYYWATVNAMIAKAWGFNAEEIHEALCGMHFGWVEKKVPPTPTNLAGVESKPRRTTTHDEDGNRDVLQGTPFWEFIDTCRQFAAEKLRIYIPDPDPMWKEKRERQAA